MKYLILFFFILFQTTTSLAQEELEKLPLIALLIKNGHLERAQNVFETLTQKEIKKDKKRATTLQGLLALSQEKYDLALSSFYEARKLGQKDPELSIYISQAHYAKKQYAQVIKELEGKTELFQARVRLYALYCDSFWQQQQRQLAFDCLFKAQKMHPESSVTYLNTISYLNSLGLFIESLDLVFKKDKNLWSAQDLMTVSGLFFDKNQKQLSLKVLEYAHLLFTDKTEQKDIKLQLARTYLDLGKPMAAATILDQTNKLGVPLFPLELAEIYRQSGHYARADYLLQFVEKKEEQLKQKLTLYLTQKDYEKAGALERPLLNSSIDLPDPLRYALAYALYKTRQFDQASQHLARVQDQTLYEKAIQLRAHLRRCQENIWFCD